MSEDAVEKVADVLAKWGVRSRHGEWSDRETQINAAREVLRGLTPIPPESAALASEETPEEDYEDALETRTPNAGGFEY